ncbi:dolichol kinase isoform X1 [Neodiprion virginianus]|uniref:dolichol kinase isoform X1 n=2 Tax=Neodiprion virginianus TaxID=2961670 RepID=UPI001EE77DCA|nr:dolichol kinase isoform X1 [Neodiprion virginianus]
MEAFLKSYNNFNVKLFQSLTDNNIQPRKNSGLGLWLAPLVGLSAAITILREDSSYSEICLLTGITGIGLVMSCLCLILRLSTETAAVKDFQVLYFLPAMFTSVLFLLFGEKGLLVSVTWGLGVGTFGTWGILQLMSYFPGCFTIGEASAVMQAATVFLLSTAANIPLRYHLPPIHNQDIATVILQVAVLFVATVAILCNAFPLLRSPGPFYAISFGILLLGAVPLLHLLLDQSPLLWLLGFIFEKIDRVFMVLYWLLCLALGIGVISYQILCNSKATTSARKSFHVLAVMVYIPGLISEPTLLYVASGLVMALFLMLELMRLCNVPPLCEVLQQGFSVFGDEKDTLISLTPLYLLAGLSFPLWLPASNLTLLSLLSGVLTIGIGDTAASVVGSKYGKHKWSGSLKSVEGTIACICSQLFVLYSLASFGFFDDFWLLLRATLAVIAVSFVEAWTDQVDNLVLPILTYLVFVV